MEDENSGSKLGWRRFAVHCLAWFRAAPAIRWSLFLVMAVSLFYAEENWRGRRAWERYKHGQESKRLERDRSSKPSPSIPDGENFYRAPGMAEWFLKPPTGRSMSRINFFAAPVLPMNRHAKVLVEILPFPANGDPDPTNANAVLEYDPPVIRFRRTAGIQSAPASASASNIIATISFEQVPLLTAIQNLARQAEVNYILDPRVGYGKAGLNGTPLPQPTISIRWENLTAMQALRSLLRIYGLVWVPDLRTGVSRIVPGDPTQPPVVLDQGVRPRLEKLLRDSFGPFVYGCQGILLFNRPFNETRPVRLAVRAEAQFGTPELAFLTSERRFSFGGGILSGLTIQPAPDRWFFAVVPPSGACTVADYLAWSDRFESDFEQMREALKRPYLIPPIGYLDPAGRPVENFVAIRTVSQTLAQRAQCQLLLGQPGKALKELALLHDLGRIFHGPPANRPMTLDTAMMDVSLAGLFATVVEDGLRLEGWQEPQLTVLQAQLEEVNLCPNLVRAFAEDPALGCSSLEKAATTRLPSARGSAAPPRLWLQRLMDPRYLQFKLIPRGWVCDNLVAVAKVVHRLDDVLDRSGRFVVPHRVAEGNEELQMALTRFSPDTELATYAIENPVRAYQVMLFNQTSINQLAMACALERYRLARGRYPDSQEELRPEFIRVLPRDVINGQPIHYSRIPDHGYQLYSVGWDETDDGGLPGANGAWGNGLTKLDWVWRHPIN